MLKSTIERSAASSPWRRLGKIKLGIKGPNGAPKDLDYFVLPERFHAKLGEKPQELAVSLPFPDLASNFDTSAAMYKSNGARACWTKDGVKAHRYQIPEGSTKYMWTTMPCPGAECEFRKAKKCPERAYLHVMIPATEEVGTFMLVTGSVAATDRLYSALNALAYLTRNRVHGMFGIRMNLRRERTEFNVDFNNDGKQQKVVKWIPTLDIDFKALMAQDRDLLAPYLGQALALPPAKPVTAEDLVEHLDGEDEGKVPGEDDEIPFDGAKPGGKP